MNLPRLLRGTLWSLLLWSPSLPALAADITWRGGAGDDFGDVRNWNLPSDLPPGLTPEQAEAFRRVPGPGDRAVVPAGVQTRVLGTLSVGTVEHGGDLLVVGQSGRLQTSRAGATDRFQRVLVRGKGRLTLDNLATVRGQLLVEGGTAEFLRPAVLDTVRLIGVEDPLRTSSTRLIGSAPDEPLRIEGNLSLEGPTNSTILLGAALQILGPQVTWGDCSVTEVSNGFSRPGRVVFGDASGRPVLLRLSGGDAQTRWTLDENTSIRFEPGSGLRHGAGHHGFGGGLIEFAPGSLGVEPGGPEDGPLDFDIGEVRFLAATSPSVRPPVLSGPVVFTSNAEVTFARQPDTPLNTLAAELGRSPAPNEDPALRSVTWNRFAKARVHAAVGLQNVVVEDRAQFEVFRSLDSGQLGELVVDPDRPPRLVLRGGQFLLPSPGHPLTLPPGSVCELGNTADPEAGSGQPPNFRGHLITQGSLDVVGGTLKRSRTAAFVNGLIENQGTATFMPGHGLHPSALFWNRTNATVTVLRAPGNAADLPPHSSLGGTFINEGTVLALAGSGLEVVQGVSQARSKIVLDPGSLLRVVGRGNRGSIVLPDGSTHELKQMFNLRAGMELVTSPESQLEVTGEGAFGPFFRGGPFQDDPGGLHTEVPLVFGQLSFGGLADQKPRIQFGAGSYPDGIGLRITRRLGWFGGVFIGNGTGTTPSTARVELSVGALGTVTLPEDPQAGGAASLGGGITFDVRGGLSLQTDRPFSCEDETSRFILHPGADVTLGRLTAFDMNTARVFNRTTVRKVSEGPANLSGLWVNESGGRLLVESGNILVREGTLSGGGYELNPSFEFRLENATLRDFAGGNGTITLFNPSRFSGRVELDHLKIGNGLSANTLLRGDPDTTLVVRQSLLWSNGGMDLGENSRMELAEGSRSLLAVPDGFPLANAGIVERGHIVNRGHLTMIPAPNSDFLFESPATLENFGTVELSGRANIRYLRGDLAGQPGGFRFLNRGLLLLALIANGDVPAEFAALYVGLENASLKLLSDAEPPRLRAAGPGVRAPLNVPNLGRILFTDNFTLEGGECDFRNCDVRFNDPVTLTGGRLIGGNNGEVHFATTFNFNGGELRLEGAAKGRFGRVTTVRNGRLFLDAEATLEALPGFNLRDGSVLSGKGRTTGGVAVLDSIIAPGINGDGNSGPDTGVLTIGTDVSFDPGSRLILDVPVGRDALVSDALIVAGKASLGGTLQVNPQAPPSGELATGPILALAFASAQGDFTTFVTTPFRDGLTLDRSLRGPPENDLVLNLVADVSANLELKAQGPLVASPGSEVEYAFTVVNLGPKDAPAPVLDFQLPANATFLSSTPPGTVSEGRLSLPLGSGLDRDAQRVVLLRLRAPDAPGSLAVVGTVRSERPDPKSENDTAIAVTAVLPGEKPTLGTPLVSASGQLILKFETLNGVRYQLERSSDLVTWRPLREFVGDGTPQETVDTDTGERPPGFFRLLIVPSPRPPR
ncbi:MAG: DUF11 domain-containing protein [Verrucomicrobiales bacterium]|nr:DUF11 domain-containing protein [Verrucomicrobiales bacterium]